MRTIALLLLVLAACGAQSSDPGADASWVDTERCAQGCSFNHFDGSLGALMCEQPRDDHSDWGDRCYAECVAAASDPSVLEDAVAYCP